MPDDPAPGWQKSTVKLATTHRWKSSPGHNILVLEAGAMRIEYPSGWHVIPTNDALAIHDRKPPDDECRAQITLMRLPMAPGRNWDEFPLKTPSPPRRPTFARRPSANANSSMTLPRYSVPT